MPSDFGDCQTERSARSIRDSITGSLWSAPRHAHSDDERLHKINALESEVANFFKAHTADPKVDWRMMMKCWFALCNEVHPRQKAMGMGKG
jgi:hypothetical protein